MPEAGESFVAPDSPDVVGAVFAVAESSVVVGVLGAVTVSCGVGVSLVCMVSGADEQAQSVRVAPKSVAAANRFTHKIILSYFLVERAIKEQTQ